MAGLLVLGAMLAGGYTLYLAKTVRVKFEGKRWALPAQVYARPLELYRSEERRVGKECVSRWGPVN